MGPRTAVTAAFMALTAGLLMQVSGHVCATDRQGSPAWSGGGDSITSISPWQEEICAACQLGRRTRAEGPSSLPETSQQDIVAIAVVDLKLALSVAKESLPLPRAPPITC